MDIMTPDCRGAEAASTKNGPLSFGMIGAPALAHKEINELTELRATQGIRPPLHPTLIESEQCGRVVVETAGGPFTLEADGGPLNTIYKGIPEYLEAHRTPRLSYAGGRVFSCYRLRLHAEKRRPRYCTPAAQVALCE